MRLFSFIILGITILYPVIRAYRDQEEIYQLPFLFSVAVLVFIFPTLIFTLYNPKAITDAQYIRHNLFSSLCIWSAIIGYSNYKENKRTFKKKKQFAYNDEKLCFSLYIFMIISFIALLIIRNVDLGSTTTGLYAVLVYPARFLRPATIMLFISYLLKPQPKKMVFLIISLVFSLINIFVFGRRSEAFNLFITIVFPLFFVNNIKARRSFIIPGILVSLSIFVLFPVVRAFTISGDYSKVLTVSPAKAFATYLAAEGTNEVVEAAKNMDVATISGNYNYGISAYNDFVYQFASSTIFGKKLKQSLTVTPPLDLAKVRDKYSKSADDYFRTYLTPTGFAAVYCEFGYFGCLAFLIFGMICKKFYLTAIQRDDLMSIMFYSFFSTFILFAVYDSLMSIPTFIIMYLLVYFTTKIYSRVKIRRLTVNMVPSL